MIRFCEKFHDDVTGHYDDGYHLPRERMVDFLKKVKEKPAADLCWITEDVERDMQNVSGTYSLDTLINEFDTLVKRASGMGDVHVMLSPAGVQCFPVSAGGGGESLHPVQGRLRSAGDADGH